MTRARTIATVAGLGVVAGLAVVSVASASAQPHESQPHGSQPVHPGQRTPTTHANSSGQASGPASGHESGHADTPPHDSHTADHHADDHATHADHDTDVMDTHGAPLVAQEPLVDTYSGATPDAPTVLQILQDGNARWVSGHCQSPRTDEATRHDTADNGQHPFATILTCADSRIPVERVFDRGVGELFVLRVAGNVVSEIEAGTIEYGVDHLHTPIVVVMGHTGCGAVSAACQGGHVGGNIRFLIGEIEPAVRRAATLHPGSEGDELVAAAVRENVLQSMFDLLSTSDAVRSAVDRGETTLVGAIYNLRTGQVEWLGEHPWQDGLISVMHQRGPVDAGLPGRVQGPVTAEATGGREGN
ncbi:MAG: hypothetical protein KDA05_01650 [Phycisphaerales bacterium]|nr:hypothetical protein [Phycisphaerales bacterium]